MSLFITSNILPINMLYVETVSSLMYDVSRLSVPSNISDLFTKVNNIHTHKTRSSSSGNFYIKSSSLSLHPDLELNSGIPSRTNFDNSQKMPLKSMYIDHLLFLIMEAEDDYVETPILVYKIANFT